MLRINTYHHLQISYVRLSIELDLIKLILIFTFTLKGTGQTTSIMNKIKSIYDNKQEGKTIFITIPPKELHY